MELPRTPAPRPFWGAFDVPEEEAGCWRVGPLTLWVENRRLEWRLTSRTAPTGREGALANAAVSITIPCPAAEIPPPGPGVDVRRFGFSHDSGALRVTPLLADRPVVARPDLPFFLPAGEAITIYVSTPLWMRLAVGEPPRELQELPIVRPPDTWFGPSTQVGELCYATRSTARLRLEDQPLRAERAVTAATLRNRHGAAVLVERLNLPVPYLSLFEDAHGGLLWTQPITVEIDGPGTPSRVELGHGPPPEAPGARFVQGPRLHAERNVLLRAFGFLFE
jgi:hypothetical protein